MKTGLVLLLVAIVAVAGSKYISIRNGLVEERASIDAAWTQVEAALTRRAGLVPEIVAAFNRSAPDAIEPVKSLTDARRALDAARQPRQKIQANAELDNALALALLAAERFRKIDGSKSFGDLQDALKEAEYRIAIERRKYNEAVEHYNVRTALFPDNLVASLSGFHHIDAYIPTTADAPAPATPR